METTLPKGVYTATLTPLKEDLSVDFDLLIEHCQWLLTNGSKGIALLGTTGEANSFSINERKEILEAVVKAEIPTDRLMIGTGCCSLPDSIELTKDAKAKGVKSILFLPPFYYKITDKGVEKYFDLFLEAVGEEDLEIYLYHFPKMTGVPYSIPLIQTLKAKYPTTIVGIKDSSGDFENMKRLQTEIPDFKVFAGTEEYLLDILEIGGAGCISATANVTTRLAGEVFEVWNVGGNAKKLQTYLTKVRQTFQGLPFSGALKTYQAYRNEEDRWKAVRPPNLPITEEELKGLTAKLEALQFELKNKTSWINVFWNE